MPIKNPEAIYLRCHIVCFITWKHRPSDHQAECEAYYVASYDLGLESTLEEVFKQKAEAEISEKKTQASPLGMKNYQFPTEYYTVNIGKRKFSQKNSILNKTHNGSHCVSLISVQKTTLLTR